MKKNKMLNEFKRLIKIFLSAFFVSQILLISLDILGNISKETFQLTYKADYFNSGIFFGCVAIAGYLAFKILVVIFRIVSAFFESRFWLAIKKPLAYLSAFAIIVLFFTYPSLTLIPLGIISAYAYFNSDDSLDEGNRDIREQQQRDYEDLMDRLEGTDVRATRRQMKNPLNPFKW